MANKLNNKEVMQQIADMAETEAATMGVTAELKNAARSYANGNTAIASAFFAPYTPLYNAFVGFVVKFTISDLSKATYNDEYAAHHRNMTQGRPQLGFVKLATAGTGNECAQVAAEPAMGGLTTYIEADQPDVVALYDIVHADCVARVPIAYEDVKTAFSDEYGISDLFVKTRAVMEDSIVEQVNGYYDELFEDAAENAIAAGTGSEIDDNAAAATYITVGAEVDPDDFSTLTDEELIQMYAAIKDTFYGIVGRPNPIYNALGVYNNAPRERMICYVHAGLWTQMTVRIASTVFDASKLETAGLTIKPFRAPWLGLSTDNGVVLAAVGSTNYIRDYPTSDFAKTVETDRGSIINRFRSTNFARAGYEPFTFILANAGGSDYGTTVTIKTSGSYSSTYQLATADSPTTIAAAGTATVTANAIEDGYIDVSAGNNYLTRVIAWYGEYTGDGVVLGGSSIYGAFPIPLARGGDLLVQVEYTVQSGG